jgi:hypothetical protein
LRNGSPAPNGFEALRELDDNHDGVIDGTDAIWTHLLVWRDRNHNGVSEPREIAALAGSGVVKIELGYHWTGRHDRWGNQFKYESKIWIAEQVARTQVRPVYDIFFVPVR